MTKWVLRRNSKNQITYEHLLSGKTITMRRINHYSDKFMLLTSAKIKGIEDGVIFFDIISMRLQVELLIGLRNFGWDKLARVTRKPKFKKMKRIEEETQQHSFTGVIRK